MFSKRIASILDLILKYFVRLNFNRKRGLFKNIHKAEFAIFFNDTLSKEISIDGVYEKYEILEIMRVLKKKNCILDIGANIGNHSIALSNYFNEVLAFEAHPKTFQILKFNCSEYKNIKLFNLGISNKKGYLYFNKKNTYNIGGKKLKNKGSIKIKVNKLDNIIKNNKKISLIKMDIEGHEYKALLGMKKTLRYNDPVIYIELEKQNISSRKKIANFLSENGYKFSYYFFHEDRFVVSGYLTLIINILKICFLKFTQTKVKLKLISKDSLLTKRIYGNFIFSRKKLNIKNNNFN